MTRTSTRCLLCLAWALAFIAWFAPAPVDDTYIFCRYADNVAAGHGAVFNIGERVEGFTSPLHTALLAIAATLGARGPGVAAVLSGLAGLGVLVLLTLRTSRGLARPSEPGDPTIGFVAALLTACATPFVLWATTGMDTALFALSVLAIALRLEREAETGVHRGTLILAGAAVVVRPEGAVLALVAVLFAWRGDDWQRRSGLLRVARAALVAGMPIVALVVARWAYYGQLLPNTFAAKVGGVHGALMVRGLDYTVDATLALAPLLGLALARRSLGWALGIVTGALAAAVVSTGGDHFPMYRMVVAVIPLLAVGAARTLCAWATVGAWQNPRRALVAGGAAVATYVTSTFAPAPFQVGTKTMQERFDYEVERAMLWDTIGAGLARSTLAKHSPTLTLIPAGAIPYRTGWHTIDLVGLTDTHIARVGELGAGYSGHERHDAEYVLSRAPDLVILVPILCVTPVPENEVLEHLWGEAAREMALSPRFRRDYRLEWVSIPDTGEYLPVWQRVATPAA